MDVVEGAGKTKKGSEVWWKTHIVLRFITLVTSFTSAIIVFKNNETTETFGLTMTIKYSDDPNFKFFAYANMVVACFSGIALILSIVVALWKSVKPAVVFFFFFLHDLNMLMLVTGACAVATAIGYEAKHGNSKAGWMAICPFVPNYCKRATMAGAISYLCLFNYFLLSVLCAKISSQA